VLYWPWKLASEAAAAVSLLEAEAAEAAAAAADVELFVAEVAAASL